MTERDVGRVSSKDVEDIEVEMLCPCFDPIDAHELVEDPRPGAQRRNVRLHHIPV